MTAPKTLPKTTRALEWNDLSIILAIGRAGSLSGAARAIGKTHSTVFRNIKAIEQKTGVRFFDAFDSGYVPTDAGRAAIKYAERIEGEVQALEIEVLGQDTKLSGRIRLTCPEAFASEHAPGIIAKFVQAHPDIRVDVSPGHGAADLSKREAEIAIRATRSAPDTAFGRKICAFRFAMYATPEYLAARPDLDVPKEPVAMIEGSVGWLVPAIWPTKEAGEERAVFQSSASRAVQNAAAAGIGLTFLPCYVGDADPRLARITDPLEHLDMQLWVLTHPDLRNTARIRALMAFLYDELAHDADLWSGRSATTDPRNVKPRPGW